MPVGDTSRYFPFAPARIGIGSLRRSNSSEDSVAESSPAILRNFDGLSPM